MRAGTRRTIAALLLWGCLFALCGGGALAAGEETDGVRVYVDGLLRCRAVSDESGVWLAAEDLCALLDIDAGCARDAETGEVTLFASGFTLTAAPGREYLAVNGRYLYEPDGPRLRDGTLWLSLDDAGKIFGGDPKLSDDGLRVDLDGRALALLPGGAAWYYDEFGSDKVFWLARIIRAEAGGQPLAGRIGVGNVVLNRVESELYPDEVFGVVFDDKFAIQFDPAYSGTVYKEPEELDVVAACLCLEGCNTVGESMYFVNPALADDSWFRNTKEFVIRIGDHDFYRLKQG